MLATVLHSPRDIRLDDVPDPTIQSDTDAIVRIVAACVCGSDLWPYRGIKKMDGPARIGHEFVGIVERVGDAVSKIVPGDFVIAPFTFSDNTCALCRLGIHTSCVNGGFWGNDDKEGLLADGAQGEFVRVPQADGTLVATGSEPPPSLIPHLLALSDVFPTGHHAAISAGVRAGSSVAVVGDGAVGLSAVLAAKRLGASRVIAMSRHSDRQQVAKDFGADEVIGERGKTGARMVREIFDGIGADFVLECVGTKESMDQAIACARPGGRIGYVGVPHDVEFNVPGLFGRNIGIAGGICPVRNYLEELLPEVMAQKLQPGKVFDQTFTLGAVAEAYRAMDERTAIKSFIDV